MVKLICPHCGATLSVGDGIDSFYCQFCGGKILLTEQDKNTIDAKVRLKELEHKERLKDREIAQERYKIDNKIKETKVGLKVFLSIIIVIVLIPLVILSVTEWIPNRKEEKEHKALVNRLYSIEEQIGIELEAQNYEKALFYANQLYSDSYKDQKIWNSKRESYISMIENAQKQQALSNPSIVFAPASSDNLVGKNYNEIVDYLSSAGFTFISTQKSLEKASESQPENTVERVLIGGKTTFTTEDYFDKDIPVIIYYYSN